MVIRVHAIKRENGNYHLRYISPETGKQIWVAPKPPITNKSAADKAAGHLRAELNAEIKSTVPEVAWSELKTKFEKEYLSSVKPGTARNFRTLMSKMDQLKPIRQVSSINTSYVTVFLKELRESSSYSESTINSYRNHLRTLCNWAYENALLRPMPVFRRVRRARKTKGTPMRGRPLTDEEFEKFISCIPAVLSRLRVGKGGLDVNKKPRKDFGIVDDPKAWEFYFRGMWLSGLRLEESLEFYWDREDKLHLRDGMLVIPDDVEKGHTDRLHPLTDDFLEHLETVPKSQRKGRVFKICPNFKTAKHTISRIASSIGKEAGIMVNARTKKYASLHDFRRSFGERWAMKCSEFVLMTLMRHDSIETTKRFYAGRNATKVRDEVRLAVGSKLGSKHPVLTHCPHCKKPLN